MPWHPTTTPTGGLESPVVTLDAGVLRAHYSAKDPDRGADVTISASPGRPVFGAATGPVTEVPRTVGGRPATLRTVQVRPAAQLSLYWADADGRWVRVDTDDTLTDAQFVQLAAALAGGGPSVAQPFRFELAPEGMVLDTSSPTTVVFRPVAGAARVVCELVLPPPSAGTPVTVGPHAGRILRTAEGVTLLVPLTDPAATLRVRVPAEYAVTDADLVRFAAGIRLTDQAGSPPN
jgi:hypothetical protein